MESFNQIPTERLEYIAAQALALQQWHHGLYTKDHDDEDLWIADFYAGRATLYRAEIACRTKIA